MLPQLPQQPQCHQRRTSRHMDASAFFQFRFNSAVEGLACRGLEHGGFRTEAWMNKSFWRGLWFAIPVNFAQWGVLFGIKSASENAEILEAYGCSFPPVGDVGSKATSEDPKSSRPIIEV